MHAFFEGLESEHAQTMEALARLLHELREHRQSQLKPYGAADEETLLAAIASGEVDEHPAYEAYLAARTLADTRQVVRAELKAMLHDLGRTLPVEEGDAISAELPIVWPLSLAQPIEEACGEYLEAAASVRQDALCLEIAGGVKLEARIAAPDAYSFTWTWGDVLLRIDTAPGPQSANATGHLHAADESRQANPFANVGMTPEERLSALIRALAQDPLLEKI